MYIYIYIYIGMPGESNNLQPPLTVTEKMAPRTDPRQSAFFQTVWRTQNQKKTGETQVRPRWDHQNESRGPPKEPRAYIYVHWEREKEGTGKDNDGSYLLQPSGYATLWRRCPWWRQKRRSVQHKIGNDCWEHMFWVHVLFFCTVLVNLISLRLSKHTFPSL